MINHYDLIFHGLNCVADLVQAYQVSLENHTICLVPVSAITMNCRATYTSEYSKNSYSNKNIHICINFMTLSSFR